MMSSTSDAYHQVCTSPDYASCRSGHSTGTVPSQQALVFPLTKAERPAHQQAAIHARSPTVSPC